MSYAGIFEGMVFPPYAYQEYPKMVTLKNGRQVVVESQKEELAAIDEIVPVADLTAAAKERDDLAAERDALTAKIAEMAAKIAEMEKVAATAPAKPTALKQPGPQPVAAEAAATK